MISPGTAGRGGRRGQEHPEGTRAWIRLDYEFDVPLIGPLIQGLLTRLVRKNADETLQGIARIAAL